MANFYGYVFDQVKQGRLSKAEALALISTYQQGAGQALHPLLHRNTATLDRQQFRSRFTGSEFFLNDHRVRQTPILPAVAYLEAARAAIHASGVTEPISLHNIIFSRPIAVLDAPVEVTVSLHPNEEGLGFEIATGSGDAVIVHSQGYALIGTPAARPEPREIAAILRRCGGAREKRALYAWFRQMGLEYGPAFSGLESVRFNDEEILAELQLPAQRKADASAFTLHPSMMDAALQAAVASTSWADGSPGTLLPFALGELAFYKPTPVKGYAYVRAAADSRGNVKKYDIDILDEAGEVCVALRELCGRVLAEHATNDKSCVFAVPTWTASSVPEAGAEPFSRQVVLCGLPQERAAEIRAAFGEVTVLPPIAAGDGEGAAVIERFHRVFEAVKRMLAGKPKQDQRLVVLTTAGEPPHHGAPLTGLLKSAAQENPLFSGKIVAVAPSVSTASCLALLRAELAAPVTGARAARDVVIRYPSFDRREVRRFVERDASTLPEPSGFKPSGVWWITGGLGGLGRVFAERLGRTEGVTLIASGRSPLTQKIEQQLAAWRGSGMKADYIQADVTSHADLQRITKHIATRYGRLDGVIHAAGVLRDGFIIKKEPADIEAVLGPKVSGLLALERAIRNLNPRYLVLFSSIAAAFGNAGQADYAGANAFLDVSSERKGRAAQRTISINWPLWAEGGMDLDAAAKERMARETGMVPLDADAGFRAFEQVLASDLSGLLVMQGNPEKILARLFREEPKPTIKKGTPSRTGSAPDFRDRVVAFFKERFAEATKLPVAQIDEQAELGEYGIDSMMVMDLTAVLEKTFGNLSKTLFFEYGSIAELVDYFTARYPDRLAAVLAGAPAGQAAVLAGAPAGQAATSSDTGASHEASDSEAPEFAALSPTPAFAEGGRFRTAAAAPAVQTSRAPARSGPDDIAIIGVAGRYPEARDLEDYRRNLAEGRDCITEVPRERWDLFRYYDPDKTKEKIYAKWGGFIPDVACFDPLFFNISPRDAEIMSPQERLFLLTAWETLEDAGYTRHQLRDVAARGIGGGVGVFAGVMYEEYQLYAAQELARGRVVGLSGSFASIANRVSYILGLHGPSIAVDTMCSSSLTTIHLACQSLRAGECAMALAGGVNVSIHPNKYIMLSQGRFMASGGRCQSFGVGGDGYVPGEGVGAVLLKPLEAAVADRDLIYGVIKGTAINHGGRTNGYTVPNPKAQGNAIRNALDRSGVDPRAISYIEAHGTGTSLGDPIEINGLMRAFGFDAKTAHTVALGSAKSNIGHCESAAGIAGVTKVLLQLKHKTLFPSLHSSERNPNIAFDETPFVVQQTLAPWPRPVTADGRELPRIAGVSSFGAGGANAHIVIAEYEGTRETNPGPAGPVLVPLSARTEKQLRELAARMAAFLASNPLDENGLQDFAYTLQVGREHWDHRIAIVADRAADLLERLKAVAEERAPGPGCHQGRAGKNREGGRGEVSQERYQQKLAARDLDALAAFWVSGVAVDWSRLTETPHPNRISLPSYPFARKRYWLEITPESRAPQKVAATRHPLIAHQVADSGDPCFETELDGGAFFLRDHRIGDTMVLPGVVYLEMARAAAASLSADTDTGTTTLRKIVWSQPITLTQGKRPVQIRLQRDGARTKFRVTTEVDTTHAQGEVLVAPPSAAPGRLDLTALKNRCPSRLDAARIYAAFAAKGFHYGPSFQGIEHILRGEREALARVGIPAGSALGRGDYGLHPSVMDAALQTVIGLRFEQEGKDDTRALPFAIDSVTLYGSSPDSGYVWIREAGKNGEVTQYDLDLLDEQGDPRVAIRGFSVRAQKAPERAKLLYARPLWRDRAVDPVQGAELTAGLLVFTLGVPEAAIRELEARGASVTVLMTAAEHEHPDPQIHVRLETMFKQTFAAIREVIAAKPKTRRPVLVLTADGRDPLFSAPLTGLIKTAAAESPRIAGKVVQVPAAMLAPEALLNWLPREIDPAHDGEWEVRYTSDGPAFRRQVLTLEEFTPSEGEGLGDGKGAVWITGGLGGLGTIFARHLAGSGWSPIILSGRSPLDPAKQKRLDALAAEGLDVAYFQVDVSRSDQVNAAVQRIRAEYGGLAGIIHSAGVIRDAMIVDKSESDIDAVFAPKIGGLACIDAATQNENLKFMVLFSSLAGYLGNLGQADYAAANAFLDAFAEHRNRRVARGERRGKTVSMNWPLWREGGMQVDESTERMLRQTLGMVPMSTAAGRAAFDAALHGDAARVLVVEGELARMRAKLFAAKATAAKPAKQKAAAGAPVQSHAAELSARLEAALIASVSRILKVDEDEIEPGEELSSFGFDSVTLTQYANVLHEELGLELTPAIFFEFASIETLRDHLAETYASELAAHFSLETDAAVPEAEIQITVPVNPINPPVPTHAAPVAREIAAAEEVQRQPRQDDGIAVVGVSGRFAMAPDLDAFWENLAAGRDCISEVPAARWDWRAYAGDPKTEKNKTSVKWGGFMPGIDLFDPLFFGISPKEAAQMDPQQRLLLLYAFKAIEDAGYAPKSLSGSATGVFVGTAESGYHQRLTAAGIGLEGYSATGRVPSVGPNRLSFLLNLSGPSEPIETACSSSLVALHRAVIAIRAGDCDQALIGGVNTIPIPDGHISFGKAGMLCEDGRCKTFSEDANGYVRGEGVGMLFIKRLADAQRDGDHIYALVKGTAQNHGGRANSLTAPNASAQAALIKTAITRSGLEPSTIGYIETHGTGTSLGDPVEINGLKRAFAELSPGGPAADHTCYLGSVKSNIGHTELAAGVAGLLKVIAAMKRRILPKSLHCERINPYIDLAGTPFRILQEQQPWTALRDASGQALPRRAGVSSFGFGGVNAHVILEEPPEDTAPRSAPEFPLLLPLSAKSDGILARMAGELHDFLAKRELSPVFLGDAAYTLQVGRDAHDVRAVFLLDRADGTAALLDALKRFAAGERGLDHVYSGNVKQARERMRFFSGDADISAALRAWVAARKTAKLAQAWVNGLDIDWGALHETASRRRVPLPTYPFAEERCWVSAPTASPDTTQTKIPAAAAPQREPRLLWQQWSAQDGVPAGAACSGRIAVLATAATRPFAERLVAALPEARFFDLHDDAAPDWAAYGGWIDLTALDPHTAVSDLRGPTWGRRLDMLGNLVRHSEQARLRLLQVTAGLAAAEGEEQTSLAGAASVGLYRMLAREYGKISSRHMDSDALLPNASDQLLNQIIAEWQAQGPNEVRYRGTLREQARLAECYPAQRLQQAFAKKVPGFPPDKHLLITGGTRGLGMLVARHFVQQHGARKLILLGRAPLPERADWDKHLATGDPVLKQKIRDIRALEGLGAEVKTLAVRLSDQTALGAALAGVGPITGVIHAAGLADTENPAFIRKTPASMARIVEPKIAGTHALEQAVAGHDLQFFVLFSSVSASVAALGVGQADYAMANAYLDAFARNQATRAPGRFLSIQWPSWKESGMGEVTSRAYRETGLLSISDAEGLAMLDAVLVERPGCVVMPVVVPPDWSVARLDAAPAPVDEAAGTDESTERKKTQTTWSPGAGDAHAATVAWLTGLFSKELGIAADRLEPDTPFQDYGVDSILMAQILPAVNGVVGHELDPSILFEHTTLDAFARYLLDEVPEALAAHFSAQQPEIAAGPSESEPDPEPEPARPIPVAQAPAPTISVGEATPTQEQARPKAAAGNRTRQDIAVIGVSCHFPGAADLAGYASLLTEGRRAISVAPAPRFGRDATYFGGFIDGLDRFPAEFFHMSVGDAATLDPQARLVLEQSLKVIHHGGYTPKELKGGAVGVYIGGRTSRPADPTLLHSVKNAIVSVGQNYLAANVSQFFDFTGPSMVIDTACSSALVAMHAAVQSLRLGEIEVGLVGGVNVLADDAAFRLFEMRKILSPVPDFHIFDQRAAGVVLGEGCGMVMLKRLDRALADGDPIYALLKGIAVNNDGRTAGPTTPNLAAQTRVIRAGLADSGKTAAEIGFIGVNGSGSQVTDLLELKALKAVYATGTRSCVLGSMKPNIGHPLAAEGIAGMIQALLTLSARRFAPFLSGEQPPTHFDLTQSDFVLPRQAQAWETNGSRAAALNCFADGGTNCHLVLEAWEPARFPDYRARRGRLPAPEPATQILAPSGQGRDATASPITTAKGAPEGNTATTREEAVALQGLWGNGSREEGLS
ncbi:SDR family NAD(P)-dependent oxidoreductase [Acanthopleuribacter pedis]|uniref:SDR family NAD(P)-dependent oxidoreductase n=1 Tax=Acanthopleuribacter pedis TaxID=442870 RepID=A0A8J7U510_9BACT|nr:SDR family NAD(P)-dependent oxidoreductase [Acanthopleuribacter pedis]MBO1322038.1 SDR family NAD(P)-dependent oxidoreductase [Acanthopleuribacter pedis]